ncbi:MAG TPA: branched-chain amino acid ABC transporter permease [Lacisediminihabitans sp.]|jgi:branched-chain amino acid transport system permease protein|nr:branched-chain amino acid ABC transporter permease [Lacisediminihabitans sp.]HXD60491.1 branched-chain amino acid ABC transporter permease [Lacisediminihabitans sp.]
MSNPLTRATPVVRSATGLIPTISGRGGGRGTHLVQYLIVAAVAVFLVALPYLGVTKFQIGQTTTILIAAMAAASVSFLVGEAGLASLGHGAIAGTASYGMAWAFHQGWDTGLSIILAIALTLAVSLIYGLLTMRTSGIYFLMVTLAIGMLIYGLAFRMSSVTGGDNGLLLQRPEWINARENWWIFYYLVLALLIVTTLVLWVVARSPFGASLRGVRDNESRMRSLGYSVAGYKVAAFMISGFVAGISGVLGAWNTQSVSPESVNVETSILLIVMVILGGVGTLLGPLVGATIVILVKFTVSSYVDRWQTLLGIVFIVVILLAREGVVGSIGKLTNRIRKRRAQRAAGEDVPEAGASASNVSHT